MIRGLIFITLLLLTSLVATGYLLIAPDEGVEEVVIPSLEVGPAPDYPAEELVLAPFPRPIYLDNKTWGLTVLYCKVYASDEHEELIGIELDDIDSSEVFDHKCILTS